MAILKHIAVKNSDYGQMQRYLLFQHDSHTQKPIRDGNGDMILREGYLMDALNSDPFTFNTECTELNRLWHKNLGKNDRKAHHYIISFDPRDVPENGLTPEKVHAIGMEFANHFFAGHQALIVTHTDGHNHSGNLHCHIVLNSLRKLDVPWQDFMEEPIDAKAGFKHHPTDKLIMYMYHHLQSICEREHLHTVDLSLPTDKRVTDVEYRKRQRGQQKMDERNRRIREDGYEPIQTKYSTVKEQLRKTIDEAVERAQNEYEFIRILQEEYHIAVRISRDMISFRPRDRTKPIRGKMLGRIYERDQIAQRIAGMQQRQEEEQQRPEFQGMPRIFLIHSELRLVVDLQTCVKAHHSRAYARKVALSNLQEMARTIAYIQEHGIGTVEKLAEAADDAEAQYKQASADLRETQNALTAINKRIHYTGQYLSHKALYRQFLAAKDEGAFRTTHKDEIDEYEDAVSHLKAAYPDGTFPSMKELKAEKTRLTHQRNQQKAALRPLSEQRRQMRVIIKNVEAVLRENIPTKTGRFNNELPSH